MPTLYTFAVRDPDTIRDDMLRIVRNGLIALGISDPNVGPGSDYFATATALSNELAVVEANCAIMADQLLPDTATGDALNRLGAAFGLSPRPAAASLGNVTPTLSATSFITAGTLLVDSLNQRYQVTVSASYANGAPVPVAAVLGGAATNHAAGDVLRWVTPPTYADQKVIVASGGLTGGIDSEDPETFRARLLQRLGAPPAGGNWSHVAELAAASHPSVQAVAVYPALGGPSTVHVAVAGYATGTTKNRDINTATVNSIIAPYVRGNLPEHADVTVTTVSNQPVDLSIALALPAAANASPPGPGGGWLDGAPWPSNANSSGTFRCTVTTLYSTTTFAVDAPTPPVATVSRVCFLDPTTWTLYHARVLSFSGTTGAYIVTVDTPMPNLTTGSFIWPDCAKSQAYVTALLNAFALMGPGEKTTNTTVLQRAYRHPLPQQAWPYNLDASQLRRISDVGPEVLSAAYLYRSWTSPVVPGAIASAPSILVPQNIGFYPA